MLAASWAQGLQFKVIFYCLLCGMALGTLKEFIFTSPSKPPPVQQIQCFRGNTTAYRPGGMSLDEARDHLRKVQPQLLSPAEDDAVVVRIKTAEMGCTVRSCTGRDREEYGRAIRAYVSRRLSVIERMDQLAGPEAARWAAHRLRTPQDIAILTGLNERLYAGHVSTLVDRRLPATYEVVLRGQIEQLVPCGRVLG